MFVSPIPIYCCFAEIGPKTGFSERGLFFLPMKR